MVGAFVLATLALAVPGPRFGVAEDATKYADDGGTRYFADFHRVGLTVDRVTIKWDETHPEVIQEKAFLDRMVPKAAAAGIQLVFQIIPMHPRALQLGAATTAFAAYCADVASVYPQVHRFIVLNEPNEAYFLAPQFAGGQNVSAAVAAEALAKAYDALRGVDRTAEVIGLSLSPEANDRTSTSPVRFLAALGQAYRASGRTLPLMDALGLHLYPKNAATQDEKTRYEWPQTGPSDLGRIKQAFYDAFAGTGQPLFEEMPQPVGPVAHLVLDELGWQVAIRPSLRGRYTGRENTPVTTEPRQARIYAALTGSLRCDQNVSDILLFHLIDEANLGRFQSGLERVDGSRRSSYTSVTNAIRAAPLCAAAQWRHTTAVAGAAMTALPAVRVSNGGVKVRPTASEDSTVSLSLQRGGQVVVTERLPLPAYHKPPVFLSAKLVPGSYTIVAKFTSALAPGRRSTLTRQLLVAG